jgi:hypothetical protein
MRLKSLLPVVDICDNFHLPSHDNKAQDSNDWTPLLLYDPDDSDLRQFPLGFLREDIANLIKDDREQQLVPCYSENRKQLCMRFASEIDTREKRSQAIERLVRKWIDSGLFSNITGGRLWRDELYAVYTMPFGPLTKDNIAFEVERSAAALFGVVTYGVHLTMYFDDPNDGVRVWVPTRSHTKQT